MVNFTKDNKRRNDLGRNNKKTSKKWIHSIKGILCQILYTKIKKSENIWRNTSTSEKNKFNIRK